MKVAKANRKQNNLGSVAYLTHNVFRKNEKQTDTCNACSWRVVRSRRRNEIWPEYKYTQWQTSDQNGFQTWYLCFSSHNIPGLECRCRTWKIMSSTVLTYFLHSSFTSPINSFMHLFIYLFIRFSIYSFIHLFIYLFIQSYNSFVYSFIHQFVYSFLLIISTDQSKLNCGHLCNVIPSFLHIHSFTLIHYFSLFQLGIINWIVCIYLCNVILSHSFS